jgi:DNA-nicking Smr family endonuclease
MYDHDDGQNPLPTIDLHRMPAVEATRALARELHAARVRGAVKVVAITGRGFGNRLQEPILRTKVEAWLASDAAKLLGVRGFRRVHRDGALEIALAPRGPAPADDE